MMRTGFYQPMPNATHRPQNPVTKRNRDTNKKPAQAIFLIAFNLADIAPAAILFRANEESVPSPEWESCRLKIVISRDSENQAQTWTLSKFPEITITLCKCRYT